MSRDVALGDAWPSPLEQLLGRELLEATSDRVVLRLPVTEDLHQPFGLVHGGVYCVLVEGAASIGANTWLGDRGQAVGVANATDFLRPVREGVLTAEATPLLRGRSQQLWEVIISDGSGTVVARGQLRLANLLRAAPSDGVSGGG